MRYPKAIWKGDGKSGGSYVDGYPPRFVVHTTETQGVPGYRQGETAPHITYLPRNRTFYQHTSFATAARALRHPRGTVQTNRARAIQLEIVCYSNKGVADQSDRRLWVGDLSDHHYEDLAGLIAWSADQFGIEQEWPGRQAFSYSEANAPGFRMRPRRWKVYNGVCGHQHVPHNTHWDPGAINWDQLLGGMMAMSPEAQEFFEDTFQRLKLLDPNTSADWARVLIEDYRESQEESE